MVAALNGAIDVVQVYANGIAYAALRADGSVITWGTGDGGGNSSAVSAALNGDIDVIQIYSNGYAFAALRIDGSLITWGYASRGGDSSAVGSALNGDIDVIQVYSSGTAFAALRSDGSVITWGYPSGGGDSSAVAGALDGNVDVIQVSSGANAFAALRADGSVITWGDSDRGGDSSSVAIQLGSNVASLADISTSIVQNETVSPVFISASVDGNTLVIKYNETTGLDTIKTIPSGLFSVSVDGVNDEVLHASTYSSNDVMLSLAIPVATGQVVKLTYLDPTNGDDVYALQDVLGNDALSFTDVAVSLVGVSA